MGSPVQQSRARARTAILDLRPHTCPYAKNYNRTLGLRKVTLPSTWFQQRPALLTDYRALNVHNCKDMWEDYWTKAKPVDGVEVRTSALASMCLADDHLAGNQLCPGTPTSYPQDQMKRPLVLQALGAEDRATTDKVKNSLLARPLGSGGGRDLPAALQWSCPD